MAESSASNIDKSTAQAGLPLDVFGQLLETVSAIAKHQAISQGASNKTDLGDTVVAEKKPAANSGKDALSPAESLFNLLQLGASTGAKGPDLLPPPAAPGTGGSGGGKSGAEGLVSIIKLIAGM